MDNERIYILDSEKAFKQAEKFKRMLESKGFHVKTTTYGLHGVRIKGVKDMKERYPQTKKLSNLELAKYKSPTTSSIKNYIDVYYDEELEPPCWGPRHVKVVEYGSLEVQDFDCADNKTEAIQHAKQWSKKSGLPLIIDGKLCRRK